MKSCLVVGSNNLVAKLMIDRLDKEGWRVSVLSPNADEKKDKHIFEHYAYDYESESVSGVIESARPDVIVFLGAYDMNFIVGQKAQEYTRKYLNGLSNLLISAGKLGVRNFVYLSSEEVFESGYVADITEDVLPSPDSYRAMVIFQGETIAMKYNSVSSMEVTVARLDGVYCMPSSSAECVDECTKMCLKAMRGETLSVNSKRIFSILYESDAAEALYKLISAPARQHHIYHIASGLEISETELAGLIKTSSSTPVAVEDATTGLRERKILSGRMFSEEFGFSPRVSVADIVPRIIARMQSQLSNFEIGAGDSGKKRSFFSRFTHVAASYVEALVCFVISYFLTILIANVSALESVNVFLLYVLLFAAFYGSTLGIVAAFLSSIGYCLIEVAHRTGLELLLDVNTYIWIAQLFIIALAVGYVRDKLTQTQQDMKEEVGFLTTRLGDVSSINKSNVQIKNFFEERVVDSSESVGFIYNIVSKLDSVENSAVLFAATDTMMQMMSTSDVAVYRVLKNGYLRIVSSTSARSRSLGKSPNFMNYPEIVKELNEKKVYVNRRLEPSLPHLIGTLNDADDNISFIVMLWDVKLDHMTQYNINLLTVVCRLIGNAVMRSVTYLDAIAERRFIDGTSILGDEAFKSLCEIYKDAMERKLSEYCLIKIGNVGASAAECSERVKGMFRFTDYVGEVDGQYYVLLTNTNVNESNIVQSRLMANGISVQVIK
ncbi:MAG: sugar nucleotide-binding protein [Eubacteriales bacterium]|nr:sugar nucleotide-binding protein [Eubacteriales bacterium]MDD3881141.1 sugar nucleotide-binding protein [Eubacteriales bacterium]MDD4511523.1 sugar nucleotide-binding protein [Eubacteriales bacterium]